MNIKELKEAAGKAEPGPWHLYDVGDSPAPCPATAAGTSLLTVVEEDESHFAAVYDPDTAAYIALANPSTILSLIARVEALAAELDCRVGDLVMLRRAVEENDPKAELLFRIDDMLRATRAALETPANPIEEVVDEPSRS